MISVKNIHTNVNVSCNLCKNKFRIFNSVNGFFDHFWCSHIKKENIKNVEVNDIVKHANII